MNQHHLTKTNGHMRGVTHHVPHRTRYRLASQHRNEETVNRLHDSLKKVPGVKKVEFNDRTGSVLVHHDEIPEIVNTLNTACGEIAADLFEELAGEELIMFPEVSLLAELIGKRFSRINQYLANRTKNYIDLKMLLPLLFAGAGLYQLSKEKGMLNQVPGWVLFYYAYDSYLKFHVIDSHSPAPPSPGNGHKGLL
jgi:hypothetical protein